MSRLVRFCVFTSILTIAMQGCNPTLPSTPWPTSVPPAKVEILTTMPCEIKPNQQIVLEWKADRELSPDYEAIWSVNHEERQRDYSTYFAYTPQGVSVADYFIEVKLYENG